MPAYRPATRDAILAAAADLFARDAGPSIDVVIRAADVSRATFYRHFRSRAELMAALDLQPDPGTRARVLAAAADLVARDGLRAMSVDELAARAAVSRASVYRLFPGKAALFEALVAEYSPFEEITEVLARMSDRPPAEVLPEIARTAARVAWPRIGILRSLIYEVTSQSPDALAGADPRLRQLLGSVGRYLAEQMAAGRMRRMHSMLAAQMLMGPIVFHLLTRSEMERLGRMDVSLEAAVEELSRATVRALGASSSPET
ncbi:MAG: TetR/AcrR family transcriptional regulator [Chloroflexota bacterium]|nr:TetR/AcrR family transcriptional regulator [Chloroflexota bacterium]